MEDSESELDDLKRKTDLLITAFGFPDSSNVVEFQEMFEGWAEDGFTGALVTSLKAPSLLRGLATPNSNSSEQLLEHLEDNGVAPLDARRAVDFWKESLSGHHPSTEVNSLRTERSTPAPSSASFEFPERFRGPAIGACLLVVGVALGGKLFGASSSASPSRPAAPAVHAPAENHYHTSRGEMRQEPRAVSPPTEPPPPQPPQKPEPTKDKIAVLADLCRQRSVSGRDLAGMNGKELTLARNQIYARHGRAFQDAEVRAYFKSKPWYKVKSGYRDSQLSHVERTNASFILNYQKNRGLWW